MSGLLRIQLAILLRVGAASPYTCWRGGAATSTNARSPWREDVCALWGHAGAPFSTVSNIYLFSKLLLIYFVYNDLFIYTFISSFIHQYLSRAFSKLRGSIPFIN